eukprot:3523108-Amphidinium_carterae.3
MKLREIVKSNSLVFTFQDDLAISKSPGGQENCPPLRCSACSAELSYPCHKTTLQAEMDGAHPVVSDSWADFGGEGSPLDHLAASRGFSAAGGRQVCHALLASVTRKTSYRNLHVVPIVKPKKSEIVAF